MQTRQILCFGDSNTWGYAPISAERYPRDVRWTGVMAAQLGSRFHVVEEGQNGRTTVWDDPLEGGHKNGLTYLTACLESHHPIDLVILMLGTNDLKARFALPALDIAAGGERLVQTIQHTGWGVDGKAPAILLAAPPPIDPQGDLAEMFAGAREKSVQLRATLRGGRRALRLSADRRRPDHRGGSGGRPSLQR
ncbi:MAG: SGNH/GDSL hydrolase family protein [Propionivibrio sp.]